ncbi:hypothetical protein ACWDRX_18855, partial [Streptomyces nigra]
MIERSGRIPAFALAAALTRAAGSVLRAKSPGGPGLWERKNYAGRTVTLHAGPACALAAALGTARVSPPRQVLDGQVCTAMFNIRGMRGFLASSIGVTCA